jgi:hypothetical protein
MGSLSACPLMRSTCVRTSKKVTVRAPINRPDTYQRSLKPREILACEQQPVHTSPPEFRAQRTAPKVLDGLSSGIYCTLHRGRLSEKNAHQQQLRKGQLRLRCLARLSTSGPNSFRCLPNQKISLAGFQRLIDQPHKPPGCQVCLQERTACQGDALAL